MNIKVFRSKHGREWLVNIATRHWNPTLVTTCHSFANTGGQILTAGALRRACCRHETSDSSITNANFRKLLEHNKKRVFYHLVRLVPCLYSACTQMSKIRAKKVDRAAVLRIFEASANNVSPRL